MRKFGWMMTICLLAMLLVLPAQALAAVNGTMRDDAEVYTGPGDKYTLIPEVELARGDRVTVRTKYHNGKETWLQVEFAFAGGMARGYVRSADVNVSLTDVPREAPLCTARILRAQDYAAAGPLYHGYIGYPASIRQGISGVVYEVEDFSALVEYWSYDQVRKCRSWIYLSDLETDMLFSSGYYGVAEDNSLYVPSPTRAPSTYYGATGKGYPVGKMITVVSGSCHVKREADEASQTVNYAYVGDRFEVLECKTGSTGKDWYRIKVNGAYGWISSGLVSLD